ncbi:hypothetical protein [Nocardia sp. CA-290969]|uniref:hypothetical protein n=1 Tax=Nocardia sp. CA-290969 TaxID=3239986 RepID=UPI003D8AF0A3
MSVGTRTETGRPARRATEAGRPARRVHDAERVKSGAAQRAYERRRQRAGAPAAPAGTELTGRVPFVAAILAMFGCGLALTLVLTTRAAEDSYQLSDAREANRVLADERAALQREVAAADSAPELATRARELGMIPADDPARLVVAPDGTITVVGEPAPAQGPAAPPLNQPPRTTPRSGADPGERVVPVPTTAPAPQPGGTGPAQPGESAPPAGDTASGSVLASPGGTPAPPQPVPGEPVPGQAPAGVAPVPEAGGTQNVPAPLGPEVSPPAPAPGEPGAAGVPAPGQGAGNETTTPAPPPAGAPVAGVDVAAGSAPVEAAAVPIVPAQAPAGAAAGADPVPVGDDSQAVPTSVPPAGAPAGLPGAVAGEGMR